MPATSSQAALPNEDPFVASLKLKAQTLARCNEKAKALWEGLKPEEQASVRAVLVAHPNPTGDMSMLLSLLSKGRNQEAETLVRKTYSLDARLGRPVTLLIGYANDIE